ncbi:unnamed protein product [Ixodes pacificus]
MPTLVRAFATVRGGAMHTQNTSRQRSIMETTASFTLSTRPSVCRLQGLLPSVSFGSTHCPSSSFHTSRVSPRRPSVRRVSQWFCNEGKMRSLYTSGSSLKYIFLGRYDPVWPC